MSFRNSTTAPTGGATAAPTQIPLPIGGGGAAAPNPNPLPNPFPPVPTAGGAAAPDPSFVHPKFYTLGDVANGISLHHYNSNEAKKTLLTMPVGLIQEVKNFLDGPITQEQTTQTFKTLADFARTNHADVVFISQAKKADVVANYLGSIYLKIDAVEGAWKPIPHPSGGTYDSDEAARVNSLAWSSSAMIEHANIDVTENEIGPHNSEPTSVPVKNAGSVYTSADAFQIRHTRKDNKPTTTDYSSAIAKLPKALGHGYIQIAKPSQGDFPSCGLPVCPW